MNTGQMIEDVRLAINGRSEVLFYGRPGGSILTSEEVQEKIQQLLNYQPHLAKTDFTLQKI
jgi:2-oxoglutarate ferredoxin oxidoreductase subunit alpha